MAIGAATREALRLVDVLDSMLQSARDAFEHGDRKQIGQIKRLDDVLDNLNTAIKSYLGSLDNEAMTEASALQLDVLRDIKQVNTHLVAAAAYRVLQNHGELLASRLRVEE